MGPFHAAERGLVDEVIDPAETRARIVDALDMPADKYAPRPHRKHGNQPR
ncbi:hypothetical protein D0T12_32185 [Actinomadura spongiicola]|uniref:Acetyl-coenzyme A carboxylase carboxyl transferase subunit beta domain-containing protein n=1 Tax=Actinomadura spongiicola TaxID=2303421 RepID=A0A372G8E2_9ACTN|nr:carboxyl transferase domain-containing protein [Actinomadura spongiicola]RFS81412.1 hypothetical protein D0T12_32185 [Actinomadura spongiicola]